MAERIFDEKTLRKLDRLTLVANRIRAGAMKGERRSTRRGEGTADLVIDIAGARIAPGDVIVADEDGVLAVPAQHAADLAAA